MVPSGLPPPSASSVSFSLCPVSRKPKERLWRKSQPILRGDDNPFLCVAASPLRASFGLQRGMEPACDSKLGLSQSLEPLSVPRELESRTAVPWSLVLQGASFLPSSPQPSRPWA